LAFFFFSSLVLLQWDLSTAPVLFKTQDGEFFKEGLFRPVVFLSSIG